MAGGGRFTLVQSLAIIDYLEETHPEPHLKPADPRLRAYAREIALAVACEVRPVAGRVTEWGSPHHDALRGGVRRRPRLGSPTH
jgi:glutathione S-transferase